MEQFRFNLKVAEDLYLAMPMYVDKVAEKLFEVLNSDREHIGKYLDFVEKTQTIEDERAFIASQLNDQAAGKSYLYLIIYQGDLVGTINYHFVNHQHGRAEIGYWLHSAYTGKGLVSRCVKAMLTIGFESLGFNRIDLYADVENVPSNAVATRTGFKFNALQPAQVKMHGQFRDMNQYIILKSDYEFSKEN